jgi:hypothetical protein
MLRLRLAVALVCTAIPAVASAAEFAVEQSDDGVTVKLDGQLFTRYLQQGNTPILWPLVGPTGREMTRQYPMREALATERSDHPHHRSLWFNHGNVNGISFWDIKDGSGTIKHRKFNQVAGGEQATIEAICDWLAPDGKKICEDTRTYVCGAEGEQRWVDFTIKVAASEGAEVKFGDTKEGSMAVRVAGTMDVDAKKGGRIINSRGQADAAAWGKPAEWVDYQGPVEGETLGIAIFNHPASFRYPTTWHVRTYGLFAANPFGLRDFGQKDDGAHIIKPGESMTLRYRIVLHKGDHEQAKLADAFAAYSKTEAPK